MLTSFSELFNSRFANQTKVSFSSTDPTDWSIALRSILHLGYSDPFYLVIDNFDHILKSPEDEQHRFSTLITHIACEPNLNVLAILDRSSLPSISQLKGLNHLSKQTSSLAFVPEDWQPPKYPYPDSMERRKSRSALSSNLVLSSAVVISMATLSAAYWVAKRFSPQSSIVASRNKTISPDSKAAMRTINVASAKQIAWDRPSADRQAKNQEIMQNPIPVAFTQSAKFSPPEIKGLLAETIDIEKVEAYDAKVLGQLNSKSILSFQPIVNEEEFFAESPEDEPHKND